MNINGVVPVPVTDLGTVTISNASPAVVTKTAHGFAANTPVMFTTDGALPAGIVANEVYYVRSGATLLANSFTISKEPGTGATNTNPAVNTTSAGSGTHTGFAELMRVNVEGSQTLGIELKNLGANALDVMSAFARFSPTGNWLQVTGAGGATDYTTPVYPVKRASGSPITLAAGASMWVFWDVEGMSWFSLRASATVAAGSVEFHAVAKYGIDP